MYNQAFVKRYRFYSSVHSAPGAADADDKVLPTRRGAAASESRAALPEAVSAAARNPFPPQIPGPGLQVHGLHHVYRGRSAHDRLQHVSQ